MQVDQDAVVQAEQQCYELYELALSIPPLQHSANMWHAYINCIQHRLTRSGKQALCMNVYTCILIYSISSGEHDVDVI
jgi:hypothetical protein